MSDLLQRLVQNARGAAQSGTLRIEPVLASRYAGTPSRFELAPQELDVELMPPTARRPAALPVAPQSSPTLPSKSAPDRVATQVDALPASDIVPLTRHLDLTAPGLGEDHAGDTVTRGEAAAIHAPLTMSAEAPRENTLRTEHSITTHVVVPPGKSPRPAQKPSSMPAVAATQASTPMPTLPLEQTQSITISIGHVEVRNVAAPASAAPRKPAFRPGVSLDAFLRRGGGDGR